MMSLRAAMVVLPFNISDSKFRCCHHSRRSKDSVQLNRVPRNVSRTKQHPEGNNPVNRQSACCSRPIGLKLQRNSDFKVGVQGRKRELSKRGRKFPQSRLHRRCKSDFKSSNPCHTGRYVVCWDCQVTYQTL